MWWARRGVEETGANVEAAVAALRPVAGHELVLTHGNGPQVGLLALQAEAVLDLPPYPLDVLGAESEGMIGYLLEQALRNVLPERSVATVLTQVVVAADDPAFAAPAKPIGPVYPERRAPALAGERGWTVAPDGEWFRRVVASPEPLEVVELEAEVLRPFLDSAAQEVTRAMQLFFASSPQQRVDHILLAGGCSLVPGLDEAVFNKTQTATIIANPFAKMAVSSLIKPKRLATDAPSLFVACGLALRSFDSE